MTGDPLVVEFDPREAAGVVAHMSRCVARGRGWVNLQPVPVNEEEAATTTSIFSGPAAPKLPLCTWTITSKRGKVEANVGVQHGAGVQIVRRLREIGAPPPDGWRVLQDHRRRGVVVAVPPEADPALVLEWMIRAGNHLAAVATTGRWAAELYER